MTATTQTFIDLGYIAASILFILGIKMLGKQERARMGNLMSALGMLIAITAAMFECCLDFTWVITGLIIGSLIGLIAARTVKMTAMPQMVALLNGFGGIASLLVGWENYHSQPDSNLLVRVAVLLAVLIGGVAFSGSLVAYGKLAGKISGRPILFKLQALINILILAAILICSLYWLYEPRGIFSYLVFLFIIALSLSLGVFSVTPIGGADMPVVIALLNSYSGLAASAAGFILLNNVLIVAGSLVGASGLILTGIMCKAMNRSLGNVLFSGFAKQSGKAVSTSVQGEPKPISAEDAYYVLEAAASVIIVPGYGMAVAQAQHAVRELGEILENNGAEVRYAIHPVAGRMPGHMNVLLAEANVLYEQLAEMDDVNPIMDTVDVCIVIGANDVVNPAAREIESSPIYGMPVIDVDKAKTVIVLKRSMAAGFAGVDNPLFVKENTRMLFGDAKATVQQLVTEFKES
ncbi:MAG: NAD(P)(+) transhydrogenase (Re/Si-specific) subunit beta [Desulfobacteraceae bacterium]|jgi:NAD(P) transhydrogenase subunit beta|nr:NAD(P)(+) transhydrogenase (Re/Si-specific) subunit beta [Desulfobacteraceae bacterium]